MESLGLGVFLIGKNPLMYKMKKNTSKVWVLFLKLMKKEHERL